MNCSISRYAKKVANEIEVYKIVILDQRTPRPAKGLLVGAIAYAASPIDLIPDFIPILGHLDDLLILPLLVWIALILIPKEVIQDARRKCAENRLQR